MNPKQSKTIGIPSENSEGNNTNSLKIQGSRKVCGYCYNGKTGYNPVRGYCYNRKTGYNPTKLPGISPRHIQTKLDIKIL